MQQLHSELVHCQVAYEQTESRRLELVSIEQWSQLVHVYTPAIDQLCVSKPGILIEFGHHA